MAVALGPPMMVITLPGPVVAGPVGTVVGVT